MATCPNCDHTTVSINVFCVYSTENKTDLTVNPKDFLKEIHFIASENVYSYVCKCTLSTLKINFKKVNVTRLLSPEMKSYSQITSDGRENYTLEFGPNTWKNNFGFPLDSHLSL